MPIYRSGDLVKVKQGFYAGKEMKVLEVKGSILLLEDREGSTTELYADQVQKQMLFG
jgi:hypothetical protein